jgi:alpha-glucoside transport system substrate-binding protein
MPSTFADLPWMAEPYLDDQTRLWCVGLASKESSGWPGTDIIESFLLHQSGVDAYDRWVDGDLAWSSPEVRRAFESYGRMVADDAVHGGATGVVATAFEAAGDPLFTDPPGCLFLHQASFMPTFFDADGHAAGTDYDFLPFPEIEARHAGSVIGAGDLFGMLTETSSSRELMRYLVSVEAQERLVAGGGALSVDQRVDTYPNEIVHREADLLTSARHFRFDASDRMPPDLNAAFWQAVIDYTADQSRLTEILADLDRVAG